MLVSLSAGEAPPYLLLEGLFTVSLPGGKDVNQGKMFQQDVWFHPPFHLEEKQTYITINLLGFISTAPSATHHTSSLTPTQSSRRKGPPRHRPAPRGATAGNPGTPVKAESAVSLAALVSPRRHWVMHQRSAISPRRQQATHTCKNNGWIHF